MIQSIPDGQNQIPPYIFREAVSAGKKKLLQLPFNADFKYLPTNVYFLYAYLAYCEYIKGIVHQ